MRQCTLNFITLKLHLMKDGLKPSGSKFIITDAGWLSKSRVQGGQSNKKFCLSVIIKIITDMRGGSTMDIFIELIGCVLKNAFFNGCHFIKIKIWIKSKAGMFSNMCLKMAKQNKKISKD